MLMRENAERERLREQERSGDVTEDDSDDSDFGEPSDGNHIPSGWLRGVTTLATMATQHDPVVANCLSPRLS